ncbi:phage tail protein [Marinomonas arenicola]|uniref:phage tail-collar fiber domain-containing protein n=1 Tax=Marinomonas arenicola TaxID=569601 RepID=UPI00311E949F
MSGTVTDAGARYIASRLAQVEPVTISHFILANIPGVDENSVADAGTGIPSSTYQVGGVIEVGTPRYNSDNAVTYSLVLGSDVGDYDFNFYGAVTDTGVLLAYQYIPLNKKRKGIGQVINRNLVLPFTNAKSMTGADLPVESWQYDYEEEISSMQMGVIANSVANISALGSAIKNHERLLELEGKL